MSQVYFHNLRLTKQEYVTTVQKKVITTQFTFLPVSIIPYNPSGHLWGSDDYPLSKHILSSKKTNIFLSLIKSQ